MGQTDLINNMPGTTLGSYEFEAPQFRVKLKIGPHKIHDVLNIINTKYRHIDSDFDKGFTQGLTASITNHQTSNHTLPKRYISALTNLAKNKNITII